VLGLGFVIVIAIDLLYPYLDKDIDHNGAALNIDPIRRYSLCCALVWPGGRWTGISPPGISLSVT
jgi:hypothetical protein